MPNSLEKIIDLIKKTKNNCIVLDKDGNPAYVVVTFESYSKMVLDQTSIISLTENELLEKLNQEIAVWKANQQEQDLNNWSTLESIGNIDQPLKKPEIKQEPESKKTLNLEQNSDEFDSDDQKYYFEPID
jgi:hypothetical protein